MGLGISEIAILIIAVIVLVKPEDAPRLARQLGILWAHVRFNWRGLMAGWQEEMMEAPPIPVKKPAKKPTKRRS